MFVFFSLVNQNGVKNKPSVITNLLLYLHCHECPRLRDSQTAVSDDTRTTAEKTSRQKAKEVEECDQSTGRYVSGIQEQLGARRRFGFEGKNQV
jgi:hypothetical protein